MSNPMQPLTDILNDPHCPIPGTLFAARMNLANEARGLVRQMPWPIRWGIVGWARLLGLARS